MEVTYTTQTVAINHATVYLNFYECSICGALLMPHNYHSIDLHSKWHEKHDDIDITT